MVRVISRMKVEYIDKAICEIIDYIDKGNVELDTDINKVLDELNKIKSDKVVEVVNCSDCTYALSLKRLFNNGIESHLHKMGITCCNKYLDRRLVPLNGYCHSGTERDHKDSIDSREKYNDKNKYELISEFEESIRGICISKGLGNTVYTYIRNLGIEKMEEMFELGNNIGNKEGN